MKSDRSTEIPLNRTRQNIISVTHRYPRKNLNPHPNVPVAQVSMPPGHRHLDLYNYSDWYRGFKYNLSVSSLLYLSFCSQVFTSSCWTYYKTAMNKFGYNQMVHWQRKKLNHWMERPMCFTAHQTGSVYVQPDWNSVHQCNWKFLSVWINLGVLFLPSPLS